MKKLGFITKVCCYYEIMKNPTIVDLYIEVVKDKLQS